MDKRQRFVIVSGVLSFGFIGVQFVGDQFKFFRIGGLGVLSVILFSWSLHESLRKNATLLTLILPFYFTVGVGLFWFLLPRNLFAQIPIVIFYGLGIYALSLTANIYTVAAVRTIALMRAARGVGFVLTLVAFFLIFDAILSLRVNLFITSGVVVATSLPLFIQGFWATTLDKKINSETFLISIISSLVIGEMALGLHFWPVTIVVGSLFLTVVCYMLLGLGQAKLERRLFSQTVREYFILGVLVFVGMFFATRWGG